MNVFHAPVVMFLPKTQGLSPHKISAPQHWIRPFLCFMFKQEVVSLFEQRVTFFFFSLRSPLAPLL